MERTSAAASAALNSALPTTATVAPARAAGYQCSSSASQVPGSYLGRNGGSQRLKGTHFPIFCLFSPQSQAAEHRFNSFPKFSHLNKF